MMETNTEGKRWCVSEAGMSSSSLDGRPGSCPSVPLVSWRGGDRQQKPRRSLCHAGVAINTTCTFPEIELWKPSILARRRQCVN